MNKRLFTSESVTEGHPDKICDQISDAILDAIIANDPNARVACETCVNTGLVLVMGEITTDCYVDIPKIVRKTIQEIGYTRAKYGFDSETCGIITSIKEQSRDIALGVDNSMEYEQTSDIADKFGAGDQGMMFGFACRETEELMPLPIMLAHKLTRRLTELRKKNILKYLRPDGKSQVTVEYDGFTPKRIEAVVVSTQHSPDVLNQQIHEDILNLVVKEIIPPEMLDENTKIFINPTGRFEIGGPMGDSGLTGRKIIVDTYGGYCPHGGGSFSGKDPTKVDRSASYMARYICKNLVASGICERIEMEIAYAIGVAKPVSVYVNTFGTGEVSDERIIEIINRLFDLRPYSIIQKLDLRKPIYQSTSNYGHFGKKGLPWEETDMADKIRELF